MIKSHVLYQLSYGPESIIRQIYFKMEDVVLLYLFFIIRPGFSQNLSFTPPKAVIPGMV
jgi:hypothetical protein